MKILEDLITSIVKKYLYKQSFTAVVLAVDKSNNTCKVKPDDGAELFGVRLTAVEDSLNNKLVVYPKIGSYVMVSLIENIPGEVYVSKSSEIESIKIDCPTVVINNGTLGGLIKIEKLVERINNLEDKFNTHTHPGVMTGSSVTGTIIPAQQVIPKTTKSELENEKVKHG